MKKVWTALLFKIDYAKEEEMYDVIIIGAGPAGISASLYTRKS